MNNKMVSILSNLYAVFVLLCMRCLSESMVIGTQNVAIGATKFTKHGPSKYLLYPDRTVYDNLDDTAKFINKYNIDIVALQELDKNTDRINIRVDDPQEIVDILYEKYNREYIAQFIAAFNWGTGGYGNSIIFNENKFIDPNNNKIQEHWFDAKFSEKRGAIATKFKWDLYQLWFVSVHFSYDANTAKLQLDELMNIVSTFSYPTVICGDFNLNSNDNGIKSYLNGVFESNGFIDIIDPNNVGTYPKESNPALKIDYCLYKDVGNTNWFNIGNAKYIQPINDNGEYFTDHWGLIFSLQFGDSSKQIKSFGGKCLDIHVDDLRVNGGKVQTWDCNNAIQQQWIYDSSSRSIKNEGGKCLDVHSTDYYNKINRALVQIWDCNGWDNQKWSYIGNQIKSENGKCLDISSTDFNKNINGGKAMLFDCHSGDNQMWSL